MNPRLARSRPLLARLLLVSNMISFSPVERIRASKLFSAQGLTLVKLLLTVGIGILVLGTAAVVMTTHLRSTAAAERAQRVRDAANRLNYFLQVEAGEAASITAPASVVQAACTSAPGSQSLFTLNIPLPTGTLAAISTTGNANLATTPIHYYNSNGNLIRCGPAINQNGSLNLLATIVYSENVVASRTTLTLQSCDGTTTSSRAVAYRASFAEATASGAQSYQPPCEIARAKSFFVVDPP